MVTKEAAVCFTKEVYVPKEVPVYERGCGLLYERGECPERNVCFENSGRFTKEVFLS